MAAGGRAVVPVPEVPLNCDILAVELPVGLEHEVVDDVQFQFSFQGVPRAEGVSVSRIQVQHECLGINLERYSAREDDLLNTSIYSKRKLMREEQLSRHSLSAHPYQNPAPKTR